jgi:hypothetical protein
MSNDEAHERWANAVRWSQCSAGERGWFWAVYPSEADCEARGVDWWPGDPKASGYEPTLDAAESVARIVAGEGAKIEHHAPARLAALTLRQRAAEKRMTRKAKASNARPLEFVWEAWQGYDEREGRSITDIIPWRVIKKTARSYFVEVERFSEERWRRRVEANNGTGWPNYVQHSFTLSRSKLGSGEGLYSKAMRYPQGPFFATKQQAEAYFSRNRRSSGARPAWADVLGIDWPCNIESVKAASRALAKRMHPDRGGDEAALVRLEEAYRPALASQQREDRR